MNEELPFSATLRQLRVEGAVTPEISPPKQGGPMLTRYDEEVLQVEQRLAPTRQLRRPVGAGLPIFEPSRSAKALIGRR